MHVFWVVSLVVVGSCHFARSIWHARFLLPYTKKNEPEVCSKKCMAAKKFLFYIPGRSRLVAADPRKAFLGGE